MALPPEPLDDVLPLASIVVVAEVAGVDDLEAWPVDDKNTPIDGAALRPARGHARRLHEVLRRLRRGAHVVDRHVRKDAKLT